MVLARGKGTCTPPPPQKIVCPLMFFRRFLVLEDNGAILCVLVSNHLQKVYYTRDNNSDDVYVIMTQY